MNPKPLHQKLYVHQNTCTPRIFSTKELYTKNRYSYSKQFLHQRALRRTPFTPEAFSSYTSYTRGLFAPQVHTKQLYTKVPLLSQAFAPKNHQRVFTPKHTKQPSQNQRPTKELLHHETFAPEGFYTTLTTEYVYTKKKIDQKSFPTRTICTRGTSHQRLFDLLHPKPLQQKIFIPQRFYTKQFLNQNASTPETFFANELVHGGDTSKSFPTKKNCATANSWN